MAFVALSIQLATGSTTTFHINNKPPFAASATIDVLVSEQRMRSGVNVELIWRV
jgi:hypothetical protein